MPVNKLLGPVLLWISLLASIGVEVTMAVKGKGHQEDAQHKDDRVVQSLNSPVKRSVGQLALLKRAILGPDVIKSLSSVRSNSEYDKPDFNQDKLISSTSQQLISLDESFDQDEVGNSKNGEGSKWKLEKPGLVKEKIRLVLHALEKMMERTNFGTQNWKQKRQPFSPWNGRKRSDGDIENATKDQWRSLDASDESNNKNGRNAKSKGETFLDGIMSDEVDAKRPSYFTSHDKLGSKNKRTHFHPWHGKRSTPQVFQNAGKSLKRDVSYPLIFDQTDNFDVSLEDDLSNPYFDQSGLGPEEWKEDDSDLSILDGLEDMAGDMITSYRFFPKNDISYKRKFEHSNFDKRQPFNPWGGKRSFWKEHNRRASGKRAVLDNVVFGDKSLRSALKSKERLEVLRSLRELYKRIVDSSRNEDANRNDISGQSTNDGQSADTYSPDLKDIRGTQRDHTSRTYANHHIKRPAFHSWAGKRDAPTYILRHKRSSNVSKVSTLESQNVSSSHTISSLQNISVNALSMNKILQDSEKSEQPGLPGFEKIKSPVKNQTLQNKEKRRGFSAWYGKRNFLQGDGGSAQSAIKSEKSMSSRSGVKKTMGFSAWHGKRELPEENIVGLQNAMHSEIKRAMGFSAWHGKRSFLQQDLDTIERATNPEKNVNFNSGHKRLIGFRAWHGKRSLLPRNIGGLENKVNPEDNLNQRLGVKRTMGFSAWHGKRSFFQRISNGINSENSVNQNSDKKRTMGFSAWHGKRNIQLGEHGKLNSQSGSEESLDHGYEVVKTRDNKNAKRSRVFRAWHGKRTPTEKYESYTSAFEVPNTEAILFGLSKLGTTNDRGSVFQTLDSIHKRPAFSAWHGKRADKNGHSGSSFIVSNDDVEKQGTDPRYLKNLNKNFLLVSLPAKNKNSNQAVSRDFQALVAELPDKKLKHVSELKVKGDRSERSSLELFKRPAFHAWSGKRSESPQNYGTNVLPFYDELKKHQHIKNLLSRQEMHETLRHTPMSHYRRKDGEETVRVFVPHGVNIPMGFVEIADLAPSKDVIDMTSPPMLLVKRAPFSAWHGKRKKSTGNKAPWIPYQPIKRTAFHAWYGKKRNMLAQHALKRPAFSAWHGKKRSQKDLTSYTSQPVLQKRPHFQAWYGKRRKRDGFTTVETTKVSPPLSQPVYTQRLILPNLNLHPIKTTEIKRTTSMVSDHKISLAQSPWKRPAFRVWSGKKRLSDSLTLKTSPSLSLSQQGQQTHGQAQVSSTAVKRPAFHAWSGKRGDGTTEPDPRLSGNNT